MFDCRNDDSLISAIADGVIEDLHGQGMRRHDDNRRADRDRRRATQHMQADVLEALVDDVLEQLMAEGAPRGGKPVPQVRHAQAPQPARHGDSGVHHLGQSNKRQANELRHHDHAANRAKHQAERREQAPHGDAVANTVWPWPARSDEQAEIQFLRDALARSQMELRDMKSGTHAGAANVNDDIFAPAHVESLRAWMPIKTRLAERRFAC